MDLPQAGDSDAKRAKGCSKLLQGIAKGDDEPLQCWMSHGDKVTELPPDFRAIGYTSSCEYAAVESTTRKMYGVQFHPEVTHTLFGTALIKNFVIDICGCKG